MGIEFRVLGRIEVLVDGAPVALGGPKQRALLAVLVRGASSAVSVDRLADEIWGNAAPADPARSIQVYVSALRAAFGTYAGVLETVGRGYRLATGLDQVDAHRFEEIAAEVTSLLASGQAETARDTAARGLALWRGPAFADLAELPGTSADGTAASRLEELRVVVEEQHIAALLELGRHAEALTLLPALVAAHPLRERFAAQLLLALHRCGRRSEALDAYRAFRRRFVDELGLEPGAELRDLHAAVLRDDPGLRVESAELRARCHLPVPPTAFIGRRAEVEQLTALLRRPDTRLVTATGPGGIGKTRLALQAAYELADAFPDGVYFVGLAGVQEPGLVLPTVAGVLGAEERAEEPLLAGVQQHLRGRRLVLLLDNFEHVEAAAPVVAELLAAAADLKVLVTSRQPLRLYGEHDFPVPQLALHDEAVPLFAARAKAVDRGFNSLRGQRQVVEQICLRLDRLPLAIELAAARSAELTPQEMLAALGRTLELAVAGARDLPDRQRTLRAAIDWSYRLLLAEEQRLFASLAVFAGGFTRAAAEAVTGATAGQLSALVTKNLVIARRPDGGERRYDMLETIREFALEQLNAAPPSSSSGGEPVLVSAADRHARYYLELAETEDEHREGGERRWLARLAAERDNLRAALAHILETGDRTAEDAAEGGLRLAAALGYFWYLTGAAVEGSGWLERALASAPRGPDAVRARALHALGMLVAERGDGHAALAHFEASGELFRRQGDLARLARSLNSQGGTARDLGYLDRAERMLEQSLALRRRLPEHETSVAIVLGNLAMVALDRADYAGARAIVEESLRLTPEADTRLRAGSLRLLADAAIAEGDLAEGSRLLCRVVDVLRPLEDSYRLIECLDSFAALAARRGLVADAARLVGAADAALAELGARIAPADARLRERYLAAARERLDEGAFAAAQRAGAAMGLEAALGYAVRTLTAVQHTAGGRPEDGRAAG